jgi:4'-phosphopantetheinyl transferase
MIPGTVSIHLIPQAQASTDAGWFLLTPDERVRAASYVFPMHASFWIGCRAALRRILGSTLNIPPAEVPIVISSLGKPLLADPFDFLHFSISHCEDHALVALSVDGPVGVDVEPTRRAAELPDCETSFCHPAEIHALPAETGPRGQRLLEMWTAKEALLKALGTGFSQAPEDVRIHSGESTATATSETPLPGIEDQVIHRLSHPALASHCAAVSVPSSVNRIRFHSA